MGSDDFRFISNNASLNAYGNRMELGSNTTELRDTYTYNDRHELTAAKTESKISGTYQELVGRKHAFTYDHQGNRLTHSRNSLSVHGMLTGHTTSYTTNNLIKKAV